MCIRDRAKLITAVKTITAVMKLQNIVLVASKVKTIALTTAMGIKKGVLIASKAALIAVTVAQWAWNVAMTANPIGIIIVAIAALIAAIDLIVKNWDWVKDKFMKGIEAAKIVFTAFKDAIVGAFKSVFNFIAKGWNKTVGKLKFTIPKWVPGIGGKGFGVPKIPMLATGARNFKGGLAIVGERGPELVSLPRGSDVFSNQESRGMAGGTTINFYNARIVSDARTQEELSDDIIRSIELGEEGVPVSV